MSKLWPMMSADDMGKFPIVAGIFTEDMGPSFGTNGDAMPKGKMFGTRTKYIHSVGAVGKVKFVAEPDTPFTGLFQGSASALSDFLLLLNLPNLNKTPNSYFSSDDYLALYAENKMSKLWPMMSADDMGKFPIVAGIFTEDMGPSFGTNGDAMPKGKMFGTRTKYIHSVGAVGKVKFVAEPDTPFTGLFQGSDFGIIRLSSATKPTKKQPLAPGLALKLLRDGVDSGNLVAMYDFDGQPDDWNFFSNKFYTHLRSPDTVAVKALAKKFTEATSYVQEISLKNMATTDQTGEVSNDVNYPFSVSFTPHDDVKDLFPTELQDDDYMGYMKQLPTVPADSILYEVYGYAIPEELGGEEILIGKIQLDGSLKTSKWGDENLFFKHESVDDDVKDHDDWAPFEPKWGSSTGGCPFGFSSQKE
eukprot:CAMPEP_0170509566 /NCGR_PEP_ID=MMETSP0208-20121228/65284_1 /TAXON_ID=197538 /ORGANISM="Strombidium inclinatum, Strain S3" /LENGTH=416 /DNA_ID=CAMNT_0010792937 /DNA_START=131 /DNA_END=1382 /DNA_ORIENTATION=+